MLYYHAFLNHAFSFATKRNPLVTIAAAYPGGFSSKRENDYL